MQPEGERRGAPEATPDAVRAASLRATLYRSGSLGDAHPTGATGLALCGGGITGALFEVGVLAALEEILGFPVATAFDAYIGASAGASVSVAVAQGVPARRLFAALHDENDTFFPLGRESVYQVPLRRWVAAAASLCGAAAWARAARLFRRRRLPVDDRSALGDLLPPGLFQIDPYRKFLAEFLEREGLSSTFEGVGRPLFIVANDVDSGKRVIFGEPPHRHVPLAVAVAASSAIPMFFEPVRIEDRDYFDGGVGRVGHLDVLVGKGVRRILVVNPVVPIENEPSRVCIPSRKGYCSRIVDKGLLAVGNQALRIANKVRLHLGLKRIVSDTADLEVLLVEPGDEESVLFLHSSMSLAGRHAILDYARSAARVVFGDRLGDLEILAGLSSSPSRAGAAATWRKRGTQA